MNELINFLDGLFNLGPAALLALLILTLSYLIRASKFSNVWIPWAIAVAGPLLFQFIFPIATLAGKWDYPRFIVGVYGLIIAVLVWAVHEFLLSKLEDWLADRGLFPKRLQNDQVTVRWKKESEERPQSQETVIAIARDMSGHYTGGENYFDGVQWRNMLGAAYKSPPELWLSLDDYRRWCRENPGKQWPK